MHGNPPDTIQDGQQFAADITDWHTYVTRWEADRIAFYLDGTLLRTVTNIQVRQPMSLGLQGFVAGATPTWYGGAPTDPADKLIEVAYVRISRIL